MIDSHCHIFAEEFKNDLDEVLKNSLKAKIKKIYMPALSSETHNDMLEVEKNYQDLCFPMIGLHPSYVKPENYKEELNHIEELLKTHKFYGIGETGIDLYWEKENLNIQEESFVKHIEWAKEHKLPLIIHCRDSYNEIINILKKHSDEKLWGIFHCFTGTEEEANEIISLGFRIGIGGIVTFKNSNLKEVLKNVPLKHIVAETDSPYLAPTPYRGKRNEPTFILEVYKTLSDIYNLKMEDLTIQIDKNCDEVFGSN